MARTANQPHLTTRNGRRKLEIRRDPHWYTLGEGKHVGYRRIANGSGSWIARRRDLESKERVFHALGRADDHDQANGTTVLDFEQARKAAERWCDTYDAEVNQDSRLYTVANAMADYLADRERVKRKKLPHTRATINAHILPKLGNLRLSQLTHSKIKRWFEELAETAPRARTKAGKAQVYREHDPNDPDTMRKRQATTNRVLSILKAGLNLAHSEHHIASKDAWERVKPFRNVDLAKIRFLSMDEVKSLLPVCGDDFRLLVQAALLTGCRYGELATMRVEALHEANQSVFIPESKNGKARHVHLSDTGIEFFKVLAQGKSAKDHMFVKANGKTWQKSEQKRPIDLASETAGIELVTFHILRHTYASHLAMAGTPMTVIAAQLGHTSTRMTEKHYAHLSQNYVRQTIQANLPSFDFAA